MKDFLFKWLVEKVIDNFFEPLDNKLEEFLTLPIDAKNYYARRFRNGGYRIPEIFVKVIQAPIYISAIIWFVSIMIIITPIGAVEYVLRMTYKYTSRRDMI